MHCSCIAMCLFLIRIARSFCLFPLTFSRGAESGHEVRLLNTGWTDAAGWNVSTSNKTASGPAWSSSSVIVREVQENRVEDTPCSRPRRVSSCCSGRRLMIVAKFCSCFESRGHDGQQTVDAVYGGMTAVCFCHWDANSVQRPFNFQYPTL